MATISEAQQSIEKRKKISQQARQETTTQKAQALTIKRQLELQKAGQLREFRKKGGLAGEKARIEKAKQQRLKEIQEFEKETGEYEKEVKEYERQLAEAERIQAEYTAAQQEAADWALARKFIVSGKSAIGAKDPRLREKIRTLINQGMQSAEEISIQRKEQELLAQQKANSLVSFSLAADIQKRAEMGDVEAEKLSKIITPISYKSEAEILSEWKDTRPIWKQKIESFGEKVSSFTGKLKEIAKAQPIISPVVSPLGFFPSPPRSVVKQQPQNILTIGEVGEGIKWTWNKAGEGWGQVSKWAFGEEGAKKIYIPAFNPLMPSKAFIKIDERIN